MDPSGDTVTGPDSALADRRLLASNGRVADAALMGKVAADVYIEGTPRSVALPLADLRRAPCGGRDRQLSLGAEVAVFEDRDGWSFLRAARDGHVGYVRSDALGDPVAATHAVCVPATHLYPAPQVKAEAGAALSFGSRVRVVSGSGAFFETSDGSFVPKPHLRPVNVPFTDPAAVAQLHFGTPYLWGGNAIWGIDCSGLVQAALLACGRACPPDSDMQRGAFGPPLPPGAPLARGDLLFWEGHVAMAVDAEVLIHANAHHMAVAYEPAAAAVARIAAEGGGPVMAHVRP